jgi:hypothetical protein
MFPPPFVLRVILKGWPSLSPAVGANAPALGEVGNSIQLRKELNQTAKSRLTAKSQNPQLPGRAPPATTNIIVNLISSNGMGGPFAEADPTADNMFP